MKAKICYVLTVVLVFAGVVGIIGCAGGKQAMTTKDASLSSESKELANMNGLWEMTVETFSEISHPSFNLIQKGNEISGTYNGHFGEFPVKGMISGNRFEISYDSVGTIVKYIGQSDGATAEGKVLLGSMGQGTFTGKKK